MKWRLEEKFETGVFLRRLNRFVTEVALDHSRVLAQRQSRSLIYRLAPSKGVENDFFLEVKCVTHVVDYVAMFPDAPTVRGRKHLLTSMKLAESDLSAGVLFSVQRPGAKRIRPYHEMDPEFAVLLREAVDKGVKVFTQTITFKPPGTISVKSNSPRFSFSEN